MDASQATRREKLFVVQWQIESENWLCPKKNEKPNRWTKNGLNAAQVLLSRFQAERFRCILMPG